MEIVCLEPEQRLNQTQLYRVKDSVKGSRRFLVYTCPMCRKKVRFIPADFLKASQASDSFGLGLFYQKSFNQKFDPENKNELFFRDFHCSRCFQPVRIVYKKGSSPASGYSLKMVHVLETIPSPFPSREKLMQQLNRLVNLFYSFSFGQHSVCYPYLWLAALILFPSDYDSPNKMARTFYFQGKELDLFLNENRVSDGAGLSLPVLFHGQFSLWLAMALRCDKQMGPALTKARGILDALAQYGSRNRPDALFDALILGLGNHSIEEMSFKRELMKAQIKKGYLGKSFISSENFGSLWESLFITILGTFTGAQYNMSRINEIDRLLSKKNLSLSNKDRELASLFLWFHGGASEVCVERFMKVGQAFSLAAVHRKAFLADPAVLTEESHPFRKVVSSLVNEFSPVFPFDKVSFLPVALLSALPWEAVDLAWETMELYSYLRSYHKFISPSVSFWMATGLMFSSWDQGELSDIFLFWTLTGLSTLTELQFREQCDDKVSLPQI